MTRLIALLASAAACSGFAANCPAQVIQLPTYRYFTVRTSVLVPDRGSAYLGGVGHAAYGSSRHGPLNHSLGSSVGSAGVSVHATIIDHDEIDRALLAEAAARRGATHDVLGRPIGGVNRRFADLRAASAADLPANVSRDEAIRRKAAFLSKHVGRNHR